MDKTKFFAAIRKQPFGGKMSQAQVEGVEAILEACTKYHVKDAHHIANILAQVFHETGTYMLPIKETVMPHHNDKNPPDAAVIARLDNAWNSGRLSWVSKPYWRDGWFGRGPIQVTHKDNYIKIGKVIGVDLVTDKNRILDPKIGAATAVVGMRDGIYTGKKLSDYDFPAALNANTKKHPRRIVNGNDGTDAKINQYHRAFHNALMAADYAEKPFIVDDPGPRPPKAEPNAMPAAGGAAVVAGAITVSIATWWNEITAWIGGLFQ